MTANRRRWWLLLATVALLATCGGLWAYLAASSSPAAPPKVARPPPGKRAFVPPPPPPPAPQPVPDPEVLEPAFAETWTRAHDRADWVKGAVVTCVLPSEYHDNVFAFADMGQGFALKGRVDVMSRFMVPIEDGRIHLVVTEPDGEAQLQMLYEPDTANFDPTGPFHADNDVARVRWSNAQPGTTVGCDAVWEVGRGSLTIVVDGAGWAPTDTDGPIQPVDPPAFAIIHGCGVTMPVAGRTMIIEAEPGPCTLRVDRRAASMPFVVSRGEPVAVYVEEGGQTTVHLDLPPEPPAWQPPELAELATVADMAGFLGADAVADAFEEAIRRISTGEWSAEDFARLMSGINDRERPGEEPPALPEEVPEEEPEFVEDPDLP